MKKFVLVAVLFLVDVLLASPLDTKYDGSQPRSVMVPDAEGRMHMIDMEAYGTEIDPKFDAEVDIAFLLYTRNNPTVGQRIFFNNLASVQNSNFNSAHPTRFTVHGWMGSAQSTVNIVNNREFFALGDFNMISVDWSIGAEPINYITARNRVPDVGKVVARYIDFLHLHNFIQFNNLMVIGHSLGGHVVGITGKFVTRGTIQVVISLDPAGPLFSLNNPSDRIAPTDGVYVEVIHTNGGTLGFREPIGQADFFPNFGESQPGCGLDVSGQCAHERVNAFFSESINSIFTGHECTSFAEIANRQCSRTGRTARMGGPFGSVGTIGNYHLTTNAEAPFSQG